jgi:hypothetical protein
VTSPPGDSGPAMAYAGSWLAEAGRRISTATVPGSLEFLLACYFLGCTPVPGQSRETRQLSANWLEENRARLGQTPVLAAIGYGLTDSSPGTQATGRSMLASGLRRLMSRNPFTDRLTFAYDLPQVVGIGLAAQALAADLPEFSEWFADILQDDRLQPSGRFQALLYEHVRALLTGQTAAAAIRPDDISVIALRYWMASAGTVRPPMPMNIATSRNALLAKLYALTWTNCLSPGSRLSTEWSPRSSMRASTRRS